MLDPRLLEMLGDDIRHPMKPIIHLRGPVDDLMAADFRTAVIDIESEGEDPVVLIDINTPGGDVDCLDEMLSVMAGSHLKFATYCSSAAYSAGAVLLAHGEPGLRFVSPFGKVMIHEMLFDPGYQSIEDHKNLGSFLDKVNSRLLDILARSMQTTRPKLLELIKQAGGREMFMLPERAVELGVADKVGIPTINYNSELGFGMVTADEALRLPVRAAKKPVRKAGVRA